ncbi:MAG: IS110 family transposase, partial [Actinomycetota bacterium]
LPRIGEVNLAQVMAEVGPILERTVDCEHACAEVGASSVTKRRARARPSTSSAQARKALATFADRQLPARIAVGRRPLPTGPSPGQAPSPHAIRILMRAWMRVIWACWHSSRAYDPVNHGGEKRIEKQISEKPAA